MPQPTSSTGAPGCRPPSSIEVREELVAGRDEVRVAREVQAPRRARAGRREPLDGGPERRAPGAGASRGTRSPRGWRTRRTVQSAAHERAPGPARPAVDDADLRGALDRRRSPTSCTARNLAKGQTGLSVAFDLPTQTGYDADHELARGEVGKVGVPVAHRGDMTQLHGRHPARQDEHVDDDQRDGRLAARALRRRPPRSTASTRPARRHDPERHHQGVPRARDLRVPARARRCG